MSVFSPRIIYKFVLAQVVISCLLALLLWAVADVKAAYSVIVAGVICIIPNSYFIWSVFRHKGARAAKRFFFAFYMGEIVKLLLQGFLFVLAIVYLKLAMDWFLFGFIINLAIFWFAPFIEFGIFGKKGS